MSHDNHERGYEVPYESYNTQGFQGTNLDAYDYYKRNYPATDGILDSLNFQSAQDMSAQIAQKVMPQKAESALATPKSALISFITNPSFLKGAALGAGIAFLATNPKVQKAVITGAVKVWTGIQSNIEEIKEQIQDVKEEMSQAQNNE